MTAAPKGLVVRVWLVTLILIPASAQRVIKSSPSPPSSKPSGGSSYSSSRSAGSSSSSSSTYSSSSSTYSNPAPPSSSPPSSGYSTRTPSYCISNPSMCHKVTPKDEFDRAVRGVENTIAGMKLAVVVIQLIPEVFRILTKIVFPKLSPQKAAKRAREEAHRAQKAATERAAFMKRISDYLSSTLGWIANALYVAVVCVVIALFSHVLRRKMGIAVNVQLGLLTAALVVQEMYNIDGGIAEYRSLLLLGVAASVALTKHTEQTGPGTTYFQYARYGLAVLMLCGSVGLVVLLTNDEDTLGNRVVLFTILAGIISSCLCLGPRVGCTIAACIVIAWICRSTSSLWAVPLAAILILAFENPGPRCSRGFRVAIFVTACVLDLEKRASFAYCVAFYGNAILFSLGAFVAAADFKHSFDQQCTVSKNAGTGGSLKFITLICTPLARRLKSGIIVVITPLLAATIPALGFHALFSAQKFTALITCAIAVLCGGTALMWVLSVQRAKQAAIASKKKKERSVAEIWCKRVSKSGAEWAGAFTQVGKRTEMEACITWDVDGILTGNGTDGDGTFALRGHWIFNHETPTEACVVFSKHYTTLITSWTDGGNMVDTRLLPGWLGMRVHYEGVVKEAAPVVKEGPTTMPLSADGTFVVGPWILEVSWCPLQYITGPQNRGTWHLKKA